MEKLVPTMSTVSGKNTITSIEGILIETVGENTVRLSSYDMNKGIRTTTEAVAVIEEGSYIINAQRLFQIVKLLGEDEITLEVDSKLNVTITFNSTETPKTYHGILGSGSEDFVLYRTIIAESDTYKAEDGCYLFGVAIVDIPKTTVTSATIVLKDANGILISQGTVELP